MKKTILIFLCLVFFSTCLFSEKVKITFKMIDGTEEYVFLDSDIERYDFVWTEFPNKEIIEIKGFESLKNLTSLGFYYPVYYGDWMFLSKIPELNNLGLIGCYAESLKFIEKLKHLKLIELELKCKETEISKLKQEKINLSKLKKIEKITIGFEYKNPIVNGFITVENFIPNFVKIKNKPSLYLVYGKISDVNQRDIKLLKQYSQVSLGYSSSIVKDKEKMKKLKDINIK